MWIFRRDDYNYKSVERKATQVTVTLIKFVAFPFVVKAAFFLPTFSW